VVTSKVSSLPEVGGEAAIYVENPREVGEIAGAVLKALKLPKKEREGLIQKGFAQAAKFSWEKVARETLRVYQEVFPWG
jgi:glycosyltransferase involved in cell wall biosynthesis